MKLTLPTEAQLKAFYDTEMTAAFPPAELKPLRAIRQMWAAGYYEPWCLVEKGAIAGGCFLWLGRPGWALLDYLCVAEGQRNRGLGAQLLAAVRLREPETVLLIESEAVEDAPDPPMAARRLGFYSRCAARSAGFDASVFGVHYKVLYLAERSLSDGELREQYEHIYRAHFSPAMYGAHIRIPWDGAPGRRIPWIE